jgi:hypothetical protein
MPAPRIVRDRPSAETWAERRALYATLLAKPDTVLLLALEGEESEAPSSTRSTASD